MNLFDKEEGYYYKLARADNFYHNYKLYRI